MFSVSVLQEEDGEGGGGGGGGGGQQAHLQEEDFHPQAGYHQHFSTKVTKNPCLDRATLLGAENQC